jgi:hypothetical protein
VQVRTDDEVYRVDAVWLGPPKATFPWRARYVAWGVGILVFFLVLTGERWIGLGFGFFSVAWALVITVVLTRFLCSRISHERPLGAVLSMLLHELKSPRENATGPGGAFSATRVRVHAERPLPKNRRPPGPPAVEAAPRHRPDQARQALPPAAGKQRTPRFAQRAQRPDTLRPPAAGPIGQPLPPTPPGWQQRAEPPTYHPRYGAAPTETGPRPRGANEPWSVARDRAEQMTDAVRRGRRGQDVEGSIRNVPEWEVGTRSRRTGRRR